MPRDSSDRSPPRPRKSGTPRKGDKADVVRLEDLAPRKPVRGGQRKRLFGEQAHPPDGPKGADS